MSFHRWITGAFLLALMVFALGANAILFSARSFQHNLVQVDASSGGILDIDKLKATEERIQQIISTTAAQRGTKVQAEKAYEPAKGAVEAARKELDATYAALDGRLADMETRFALQPLVSPTYDPQSVTDRIDALAAQTRLTPPDREQLAKLREVAAKLEGMNGELAVKEDEASQARFALERATADLSDSDRQILGLKSQFGNNYDRIHNEAEALQRVSIWNIGSKLVAMHPTYLSTLLVCLMGGLGGILFLFPAYVANKFPVTFVVIIVRLVFGMVTALAFYIVANATLAGFAFMPGQETQTTSMSLNPFTVSLLGIIAGVMADDIAEWIHNRGRDILGGGRGPTAAPTRVTPADAPASPPRGGAVGGAAAPAPSPVPAGQAVGLFGADPFGSAAADAIQSRVGSPDAGGDGPPRGGVVRRS